jgi:hypothetical protein
MTEEVKSEYRRIIFAPSLIKWLIVLSDAIILLSSNILPSLTGTLKSHLSNTFFPFTSISWILFFILSPI